MSADKAFLDTNILVYAFTSNEPEKKETALSLFDSCLPVISTQVIREFSNVLLKKTDYKSEVIKTVIGDITSVSEITLEDISYIEYAIDLHEQYGYSFYDSLILSSALKSNCSILVSEDFQNGQILDNRLRIHNPFV